MLISIQLNENGMTVYVDISRNLFNFNSIISFKTSLTILKYKRVFTSTGRKEDPKHVLRIFLLIEISFFEI